MRRICTICGSDYITYKETSKCCSRKCYYKSNKNGEIVTCQCGKEFYLNKSRIKGVNFCSVECSVKYRVYAEIEKKLTYGIEHICSGCGKHFFAYKTDNRTYCSVECYHIKLIGHIQSKETKEKRRNNAIDRLNKRYGERSHTDMFVGIMEKPILDEIEKKIGYKIIRQHRVCGYFLDGYCKALNLAIEIDERHHSKSKQKEKDIHREEQIKNKINCVFKRMKVKNMEELEENNIIDKFVEELEQEKIDQMDSISHDTVDVAMDEMAFLWEQVRTKLEGDKQCFSCKKKVDFSVEPLHVLQANNVDPASIAFVSICSVCKNKIEEEQAKTKEKEQESE